MQVFISAPIILIVAISVLVVASLGIRARRQAEFQNQQLNAILSSMGEGMLVVDTDGKIIIINQAAGVLLRQAPQEMVGKRIESAIELHSANTREKITTASVIAGVIAEQDVLRFSGKNQVCYQKNDGTCFPINLIASPFFYDGALHGVVILLQSAVNPKKSKH